MMRWARKHQWVVHFGAYLGPPAVLYTVSYLVGWEIGSPAMTWACIALSIFVLRFFGENKARHEGYATGLRHAQQGVVQLTKTAALYGAVRERETLRVVMEMIDRQAAEHENDP